MHVKTLWEKFKLISCRRNFLFKQRQKVLKQRWYSQLGYWDTAFFGGHHRICITVLRYMFGRNSLLSLWFRLHVRFSFCHTFFVFAKTSFSSSLLYCNPQRLLLLLLFCSTMFCMESELSTE